MSKFFTGTILGAVLMLGGIMGYQNKEKLMSYVPDVDVKSIPAETGAQINDLLDSVKPEDLGNDLEVQSNSLYRQSDNVIDRRDDTAWVVDEIHVLRANADRMLTNAETVVDILKDYDNRIKLIEGK